MPDNKEQAVKKLEATEHRLARNPEHAKAYDLQMIEVNQEINRRGSQEIQRSSPLYLSPLSLKAREREPLHPTENRSMIYMVVSEEIPSLFLADSEIQFRGFGCHDNRNNDTLEDLFPRLEQNEESIV